LLFLAWAGLDRALTALRPIAVRPEPT